MGWVIFRVSLRKPVCYEVHLAEVTRKHLSRQTLIQYKALHGDTLSIAPCWIKLPMASKQYFAALLYSSRAPGLFSKCFRFCRMPFSAHYDRRIELSNFSLLFLTKVLASKGRGGGTGSPEIFLIEPKRGGQASKQVPHFMHFS